MECLFRGARPSPSRSIRPVKDADLVAPPRLVPARPARRRPGALMDHLALAVHDQERSREFYERYLGFERKRNGVRTVR